jgi:hypothetical protein
MELCYSAHNFESIQRHLSRDFQTLSSRRYDLSIGKMSRVPGVEFMDRPFSKQIDFNRELIERAYRYFYCHLTNYAPLGLQKYYKRHWWHCYRNSLWFVEQTRYFGDFYPHKYRPTLMPFNCRTGVDSGDTDEGRQHAVALMLNADPDISSYFITKGGFTKRILRRRC